MSFDLQIYYWQMLGFLDLASDFPNVQFILNHTGMQVDGPDHFHGWRESMRTLAKAPNVACKISGLGMGDWTWTTETIRPYDEETIEAFGIDGCMFASNFPVDKLFSTYDALWKAFSEVTAGFSKGERLKIFHDNAAFFYRL